MPIKAYTQAETHIRDVDEPVRLHTTVDEAAARFPRWLAHIRCVLSGRGPQGERAKELKRIAVSHRRCDPTLTAGPGWVRRFRDWYRRWIAFLREPPQGPFWHEHHDR